MSPQTLVYKRILLKISGEALMGQQQFGIDPKVLDRLALEMGELSQLGIEIGLVIGGGNMFRGQALSEAGLDRITADHMGMLATVMNALAMRDALERAGFDTRLMSAIPLSGLSDHYDRRKANNWLSRGHIVLFAAGTGTPLVTTDSAASLRAIEIKADILIKATNVDGIFDRDPSKFADAKRYQRVSYQQALSRELGVMDLAAFCQCRDHNLKIRVCNIHQPGALLAAALGQDVGTLVDSGDLP